MKKLTKGLSVLVIICMLITMMPKVDFANEVTVESVEAQLKEIHTLQQMQAERASYTTSNEYKDYLADMFEARAEAAKAYAALSEEDKASINSDPDYSELVKELDNNLDTVWKEFSETVPDGVQEYQYYVAGYSYEVSNHKITWNGGLNNTTPQTHMLVDTAKNAGEWAPNGQYSFGKSNYEVVYCSDFEVNIKDGYLYKRVNLEDSTYYDDEAAEHIRAIVSNSYPFISLEEMKKNLAEADFEYAGQLTRGDIIAAVQMAIWKYSNDTETTGNNYQYSGTFDLRLNNHLGPGYHDYTNELWDWWIVDANQLTVNEEVRERVNALAQHLVELEGKEPDTNQIVINEVNIKSAEPVQAEEDVYNVALKVLLNNGGTSAEDNIEITVETASDSVTKKVELGKNEYDIVIKAKADETISVLVEGKQKLSKGVYVYEPKPANENDTPSRKASQTLVGVAGGLTAIRATASVPLNITETDSVKANLKLQKTDEKGVALTGAAFDLYFHGKEATYNIGTYPVDENGELIVENLFPGNYELVESIVPEGYTASDKPIAFSIDEEGTMTLDNSADAELVDDVMVVKNYPTPITPPVTPLGSLSIKKVDSVSKETLEGATFTLKGKDFERTLTTGKDGTLLFSGLAYGEYTLTETVAPAGYAKDATEWPIKIGSGEGAQLEWVQEVANTPVGSLEITKIDADTRETLEGAEFTLTNQEGNVVGTLTTDENGKVTFENLPYGEYRLEEIKAPEGYLLSKEATDTFTILEPGQKVEFTYENTRKNPSLAVEKTADKTQYLPGETVTYTINVTNDGNVDLKGITLEDVFSKNGVVAEQQLTVEGYEGAFDLAIGETMSFISKFVIPEDDLADTTYKNVVTTTTGDFSDEAEVVIVVDPTYAFTIEKTADKSQATVGETVTYTIVVTNTGNKALTNVLVKDDMIGLDTVIDQLAVNESKTLLGEYVVTADDIGELENIATATVVVDGEPITHDASVTVEVSEKAEAAVDETNQVINSTQNPQTGDTTINTLLVLFVFVLAGSGLYIYRRKYRG